MDKNFSHLRIGFVGTWFGTVFLTLAFAICLSIYLNSSKVVTYTNQNFRLYAALPQKNLETSQDVLKKDARSKIVENFFKGYQSPLAQYSDLFIKVADERKLDFRLLPAISMQESNGGKKVIKDSKNPFGYGIYGKLVTKFESWEASIERVGRALREDYLDKGLNSPTQIMAKYTPPSAATGGTWAKGVNSFMEELR